MLNNLISKIYIKISSSDVYKYRMRSLILDVKYLWLELIVFAVFYLLFIFVKINEPILNNSLILIIKTTMMLVLFSYVIFIFLKDRKIFLEVFKQNKRFLQYNFIYTVLFLTVIYLLLKLTILIFSS